MCKDCVDQGAPEPFERLPFSSYCQPHRTARGKARYQERKKVMDVLLTDMTEEQRNEQARREAAAEAKYQREWDAGLHRTPPEDPDS